MATSCKEYSIWKWSATAKSLYIMRPNISIMKANINYYTAIYHDHIWYVIGFLSDYGWECCWMVYYTCWFMESHKENMKELLVVGGIILRPPRTLRIEGVHSRRSRKRLAPLSIWTTMQGLHFLWATFHLLAILITMLLLLCVRGIYHYCRDRGRPQARLA